LAFTKCGDILRSKTTSIYSQEGKEKRKIINAAATAERKRRRKE
jgi:hypothetical protein